MQKETFEWVQSWQDHNEKEDLPRVLLVGDSITRGYESFVREKLKGVAYVDYIATSYAIDSKAYLSVIKSVFGYNKYTLVHFNNGLHGVHISRKSYESRLEKALTIFGDTKVVLALTTNVYYKGENALEIKWAKRVEERNAAAVEVAEKLGIAVDDLFSVSKTLKAEDLMGDGVHCSDKGSDILADAVAKVIKDNL